MFVCNTVIANKTLLYKTNLNKLYINRLSDFPLLGREMNDILISIVLLISVSDAIKFQYNETQELLITQDGRIRGIRSRNGSDLVVGGLVSIHGNNHGKCNAEVNNHISNENLEALLYAIDTVNCDPNLLPNLTLGYDIRDTCGSEKVGLDEAIDIIYSNGEIDIESCSSEFNLSSNSTTFNTPVLAVIGTSYSSVTLSVAGLFHLFKMPQVSFSSTSPLLSNRELYPYFFRTIPPDDYQVQAMIDLILHFKWDHVSTLYSTDRYGQPAINAFHKLAYLNKICLDMILSVDQFSNYGSIANQLYNSSANVVVLFASVFDVEAVLTAVLKVYQASSIKRQFLWIASDTWAELDKYSEITIGKWGIAPLSEHISGFENYISQLTLVNNKRNPWFNKSYHNCSNGTSNCANNIFTSSSFTQSSFDALAIDAVYTIANALHNFIEENCATPLVWHPQNRSCLRNNSSYAVLAGGILKTYIRYKNATSLTENAIKFDSNGNSEGSYKILNYQLNTSSNCRGKCEALVHVGTWDGRLSSNRLKMFHNVSQQFGIDRATGKLLTSIRSNCRSCSAGHIKRSVTSSCCGTCDPCLGSNYTNTEVSTECIACPQNMWGNNPLSGNTHCISINDSYLKPSDVWGIILILLSIIGLTCVLFVACVFIWFWNTPIVKSSGREQMIIVLIGVTLCFLITIVFLVKPSPVTCGIQWAGIWVSFSLMLSALLVKLVRIARIAHIACVFTQKKAASRPKFVSPTYQILFTLLLTTIPVMLTTISQTLAPLSIEKYLEYNETFHNSYPNLIRTCKSPHVAVVVLQMTYLSVLLIACNGLAVMTIRLPENFNESKYVAFATFSLVLSWFFFVLLFVISSNTPYQGAALSTTIQISAIAVLVCLFCPRVFIMIALPSKNVKSQNK